VRRKIWVASAGIGLVLGLISPRNITFPPRDRLFDSASAYGQDGDELPRKAPEECGKCQDALDAYWKMKDDADILPFVPSYFQDELDAAEQAYLSCISECHSRPTPEPAPLSVSISVQDKTALDCFINASAHAEGGVEPYTYEWEAGAPIGGNGAALVTLHPNVLGSCTVRVTATDANGQRAAAETAVEVNPMHSVSSGSESEEYDAYDRVSDVVCSPFPDGGDITFSATESTSYNNSITVGGSVPLSVVTASISYSGSITHTSGTGWSMTLKNVPPGVCRAVFCRAKLKVKRGVVRVQMCGGSCDEVPWEIKELLYWEWQVGVQN
jgi:hypothetical protein